MADEEKNTTTVSFPSKEIKQKIMGQARIEGFDGMGDFIVHLYNEYMDKKEK